MFSARTPPISLSTRSRYSGSVAAFFLAFFQKALMACASALFLSMPFALSLGVSCGTSFGISLGVPFASLGEPFAASFAEFFSFSAISHLPDRLWNFPSKLLLLILKIANLNLNYNALKAILAAQAKPLNEKFTSFSRPCAQVQCGIFLCVGNPACDA